jgi:hypothetical protein
MCPPPIPTTPVMVYKDKDEAAVRWDAKPKFYSKTEAQILTIIQQARHVINNPEKSSPTKSATSKSASSKASKKALSPRVDLSKTDF